MMTDHDWGMLSREIGVVSERVKNIEFHVEQLRSDIQSWVDLTNGMTRQLQDHRMDYQSLKRDVRWVMTIGGAILAGIQSFSLWWG